MNTIKSGSLFLLFLLITSPQINKAYAGAEPLIGEISYFAGTFAPRGWAFCDGQLLAISQNTALFSLLGTTYGGDGRITFGLPDLRGRIAIHQGTGPGLSNRNLGSRFGRETEIINANNLPTHNHALMVTSDSPSSSVATNRAIASTMIYTSDTPDTALHSSSIENNVSGGQSISNLQPATTARCIIALVGIIPSRN